ncbi:MAG: T9SS type A sorting domain-containing protein [Flavobacteriales bacterium]
MKKLLLAGFAAILSTGAFAQTPLTTAVDFTVTDVHGHTHNLFDILDGGQHVLIDFFFTTCPPCIQYQPDINASFSTFGCGEGDVFYFSMDNGDTDAQVLAYENDHNGMHPAVSGIDGGGNAVCGAFGISQYPSVILIAPNRDILVQDIWPPSETNIASTFATHNISEQACGSGTGIEDLETAFTGLAEVYPNPADRSSTIAFGLENSSSVRFDVYDVLGIKVASVGSQNYPSGANRVNLAVDHLSAGNYFVSMVVDNANLDVKKLSVFH